MHSNRYGEADDQCLRIAIFPVLLSNLACLGAPVKVNRQTSKSSGTDEPFSRIMQPWGAFLKPRAQSWTPLRCRRTCCRNSRGQWQRPLLDRCRPTCRPFWQLACTWHPWYLPAAALLKGELHSAPARPFKPDHPAHAAAHWACKCSACCDVASQQRPSLL